MRQSTATNELMCISEIRFENIAQCQDLVKIDHFEAFPRSFAAWKNFVAAIGGGPIRQVRVFHATSEIRGPRGVITLEWLALDEDIMDWALKQKRGFRYGDRELGYFDFNKEFWMEVRSEIL